jgi:hypothetical protein
MVQEGYRGEEVIIDQVIYSGDMGNIMMFEKFVTSDIPEREMEHFSWLFVPEMGTYRKMKYDDKIERLRKDPEKYDKVFDILDLMKKYNEKIGRKKKSMLSNFLYLVDKNHYELNLIKDKWSDGIDENLTYDELDLDSFTRCYLVGKSFKTEEETKKYLLSVIDESRDKNVEDYVVVREDGDTTLKPFRIYPKASDMELRRKEASEFIKKNGILSTPSMRYVTYPLYAYVEYEHIGKIKELGVSYRFEPLGKIVLTDILSRFVKEKGYHHSLMKTDYLEYTSILRIYEFSHFGVDDEYSVTKEEIDRITKKVSGLLNEFNNKLGSDYYIHSRKLVQTEDSMLSGLRSKLGGDMDGSGVGKMYREAQFVLKRGKDEDEYLAVVEMESLDKPKMRT